MNTSSDLKQLDYNAKVLILVEALNIVRHILIRTFKINSKQITRCLVSVNRSIQRLINAANIDITFVTRESRKTLT